MFNPILSQVTHKSLMILEKAIKVAYINLSRSFQLDFVFKIFTRVHKKREKF